jgi:hypothetical protein
MTSTRNKAETIMPVKRDILLVDSPSAAIETEITEERPHLLSPASAAAAAVARSPNARFSVPVSQISKKYYRRMDERISDYLHAVKSKKFKECEYKFGEALADNGYVQVFKFHLCGSNGLQKNCYAGY